MPRAVQFGSYGGLEVLEIREVSMPSPQNGEIVVRVRAAGVNPGEAAIREGLMDAMNPAHFPSGQGTEFSGVVVTVADNVTAVALDDEVIGFSDGRDAQADFVRVPVTNVLPKPENIDWETAAVIPITGATATSMIQAVKIAKGDTVVVAGGAGGVGATAVQLAILAGAHVIATAGARDQEAVRRLGATPVVYGDGVLERIQAAAPGGVDAFLDTHGDGNADLAIALGVSPDRIDTIIDFAAGQRLGILTQGMYQLADIRATIVQFADLVASGAVNVPIRARFHLEEVREAYLELAGGRGIGKVVLDVSGETKPGD